MNGLLRSAFGRVYNTEAAHRLVPWPVAHRLVKLRAERAWADVTTREHAILHMEFLLGKSARAGDVEECARGYVEWALLRAELRWRPWRIDAQRVENVHHIVDAQRGGTRGVVLNFMHHGQFDGSMSSLARVGARCHVVMASHTLGEDVLPYVKQHVKICMRDADPIAASGGSQEMVSALKAGAVLAIVSDIPGHTPVTFLGRDVLGSFGAARLAALTDSPVVLMTSHCDDDGPYLRIHEPLEPRDFATPTDLLHEMVKRHEPAVLAWPEAVERPLCRWAPLGEEDTARFGVNLDEVRI